jgi:hypothetical protein
MANKVLLLASETVPLQGILETSFGTLASQEDGSFHTTLRTKYYDCDLVLIRNSSAANETRGCICAFTAEATNEFEALKDSFAQLKKDDAFSPDAVICVAWGECSSNQKKRHVEWALDVGAEIVHTDPEAANKKPTPQQQQQKDDDDEEEEEEEPYFERVRACMECNVWPEMRMKNAKGETKESRQEATSAAAAAAAVSKQGSTDESQTGDAQAEVASKPDIRSTLPASMFANRFEDIAQPLDGDDAFSDLLAQMMTLRAKGHEMGDDTRRERAAQVALQLARMLDVDFDGSDSDDLHDNDAEDNAS